MDILTNQWVEAVKNSTNSLQAKYNEYRGMLLTEGDLECHLFSELLQQKCITGYYPSKDGKSQNKYLKTTFVHSQVTWFKPYENSGFEVDITICEPKKLEIVNIELFEEHPSKGFAYDGECVAIEIKFIRDIHKASKYGIEDYLKFRDNFIELIHLFRTLDTMKKIFLPSLSPYRSINAKCSQCNSTTTFSGFMRVRMESEINNYPEYQCQSCGKLKFSYENLTVLNENGTKNELLFRVALNESCECGGQYRRDKNIFCPNCLNRHNSDENKCDLNLLFIPENEFEKLSNS